MTKNNSLIFERLKKEDESVLIKVYESYRDEFISWLVKKYNCDIDEALEVYQNSILAFCENVRNKSKIVYTSTVKTYLFSLGKNKYSEYKRYRDRCDKDKSFPLIECEENINEEELLKYEDNLKKVQESLVILGEPCKSLLEMFYYHQKTCEEIGTLMEYKNEDTVKNQKRKCMIRLKKIFEQQTENIHIYSN
jgi:RNA polymerase sigma-70 factor (ECF subfamily)